MAQVRGTSVGVALPHSASRRSASLTCSSTDAARRRTDAAPAGTGPTASRSIAAASAVVARELPAVDRARWTPASGPRNVESLAGEAPLGLHADLPDPAGERRQLVGDLEELGVERLVLHSLEDLVVAVQAAV